MILTSLKDANGPNAAAAGSQDSFTPKPSDFSLGEDLGSSDLFSISFGRKPLALTNGEPTPARAQRVPAVNDQVVPRVARDAEESASAKRLRFTRKKPPTEIDVLLSVERNFETALGNSAGGVAVATATGATATGATATVATATPKGKARAKQGAAAGRGVGQGMSTAKGKAQAKAKGKAKANAKAKTVVPTKLPKGWKIKYVVRK